jgi:hypothetical protein
VEGFYFDDLSWTIRYLVVDTREWLSGRRVLLPAASLGQADWEGRTFPVSLTRDQAKLGPDVDTEKPVSCQREEELHVHYGWAPYWRPAPTVPGIGAFAVSQKMAAAERKSDGEGNQGDPYLRSTKEVIGCHIQSQDGEIGHVEDFIIEDETWIICYLVIDTRNWLPGKTVRVAPHWVEEVNWADKRVYVDLPRETIRNSPEQDLSHQ